MTLIDALNLLTIDDLKKLLVFLPVKNKPIRKGELVTLVKQHLEGARLEKLWNQLDELQQLTVSETVYNYGGVFRSDQFKAKHSKTPELDAEDGSFYSYREKPTLLRLFIFSDSRYGSGRSIIPLELQQQLRNFVPKPPKNVLNGLAELPESYCYEDIDYELADDDEGITVITRKAAYKVPTKEPKVNTSIIETPITLCLTEKAALQDLQTLLRLITQGKIAVSNKTLLPSKATTKTITDLLQGGDFYNWQEPSAEGIGPIKAFAWPMMMQAAKLAELQGTKLALTKSGHKALSSPLAETIRLIWTRWIKSTLTDEFNRIDVVKGQKGKGKRSMTAANMRRPTIVNVLSTCPIDQWVKFDEFSRFMQAENFHFEVTRDPWTLYISDYQNGSLGYEGHHDWHLIQGRYILCLLFEYAATLGLIDIAYIDPEKIESDFDDICILDDSYLSRYDGLLYFRINPLGAYCLGLMPDYVEAQLKSDIKITVLPNLKVTTSDPLSIDQTLLLENYAEKLSDQEWRLSPEKMLAAVENGHKLSELTTFLTAGDDQPLPETVEWLIAKIGKQGESLAIKGPAILIECINAEVANTIAQHEYTKKHCLLAGEHHLVVKTGAEKAFRTALRKLGYGMPNI